MKLVIEKPAFVAETLRTDVRIINTDAFGTHSNNLMPRLRVYDWEIFLFQFFQF